MENVIFDGTNYQAAEGNPFWKFNDDRVTVIFIDCYFTNNDVMYQISNGVNARFLNWFSISLYFRLIILFIGFY